MNKFCIDFHTSFCIFRLPFGSLIFFLCLLFFHLPVLFIHSNELISRTTSRSVRVLKEPLVKSTKKLSHEPYFLIEDGHISLEVNNSLELVCFEILLFSNSKLYVYDFEVCGWCFGKICY